MALAQEREHPLRLSLVCGLMGVLYFLAYGFFGMGDTDQGFIPALAWRILQGEHAYLDFIYVRPPLTPYLHAGVQALLPDSLELLGERLLFYLMMAASVCWATFSLRAFFSFRELSLTPEWFAIMAFVLSVHNFAPMAWHTVDGIFFASLGAYLLTRPQRWLVQGLGMLCLVAAALCKQAFLPLVPAGLVLGGILFPWSYAWRLGLGFGVGLLGLLSLALLTAPDFWAACWDQTTGASRLSDLVEVGLTRYAQPFLLIVFPLLLVWRAQVFYRWRYVPAGIFGLAFMGLLGLHVWKAFATEAYVPPSYGFSQAFFLLAVGIAVKGFWVNPRAFALLLFLLLISWCSGISWGYATPMLYFTPIIFAFLFALYEELDFTVPRYFYGTVCIILIWVFAILYQYPYRDAPKDEMVYHLQDLSPKYTGLRTGEAFFEETRELLDLAARYDSAFTVLPAYPLAHYLVEKSNPYPVDWTHNAESDYEHRQEELQAILQARTRYVFVQQKAPRQEVVREKNRYGSLITGYVMDHWEVVEKGQYFWVYAQQP